MYTGHITQESDGTFTSSYGHAVTQGPTGDLYVGGAPIGLRTGIAGGLIPSGPAWNPFGAQAAAADNVVRPGPFVGGSVVQPASGTASIAWSALPVYVWMLVLGGPAATALSAPRSLALHGLPAHHPAWGVAAFMLSIWAYRTLMVVRPGALLLGLASAPVWAAVAWAASRSGRPRVRWAESWPMLREQLATTQGAWALGAALACLAFHAIYWRHRCVVARREGWIFNTRPVETLKQLLFIAVLSAAIGALIAWARH